MDVANPAVAVNPFHDQCILRSAVYREIMIMFSVQDLIRKSGWLSFVTHLVQTIRRIRYHLDPQNENDGHLERRIWV